MSDCISKSLIGNACRCCERRSGDSSCDASDEKRADAWLLPVWETMPDRVYTPTVLLLAELLADVRRESVEAAISAFHDACTDDPHVLEQAMRGSLFTSNEPKGTP